MDEKHIFKRRGGKPCRITLLRYYADTLVSVALRRFAVTLICWSPSKKIRTPLRLYAGSREMGCTLASVPLSTLVYADYAEDDGLR